MFSSAALPSKPHAGDQQMLPACIKALQRSSDPTQLQDTVLVDIAAFVKEQTSRSHTPTQRERRMLSDSAKAVGEYISNHQVRLSPVFKSRLFAAVANLYSVGYRGIEAGMAAHEYQTVITAHFKAGKSLADQKSMQEASVHLQHAHNYWRQAVASKKERFVAKHADLGVAVLSVASDVHWKNESPDESQTLTEAALALLTHDKARPEAHSLAMKAFNRAVSRYQSDAFEDTIAWLQLSASILEHTDGKHKDKQARTYQILALSLQRLRRDEDALKAVEMSLSFCVTGNALFVKADLLLGRRQEELAARVIRDVLTRNDCSLDQGMTLANKACDVSLPLGIDVLDQLAAKYPSDNSIESRKLGFLLKAGDLDHASSFIDEVSAREKPSKDLLQGIFAAVWNFCIETYHAKQYEQAMLWIQKALAFTGVGQAEHAAAARQARCHRALSMCAFELNRFEEAKRFALKAESFKPDVHSLVHTVRAMLRIKDPQLAPTMLKLVQSPDCMPSILAVLAQEGLDHKSQVVAREALGALLKLQQQQKKKHSNQDQEQQPQQQRKGATVAGISTLTILQNLIHLHVTQDKEDDGNLTTLANYTLLAAEALDDEKQPADVDLTLWFAHKTFNLGLECGELSEHNEAAYKFFKVATHFFSRIPPEKKTQEAVLDCATLCATAVLECAWTCAPADRIRLAKEAILALRTADAAAHALNDVVKMGMHTLLHFQSKLFQDDPNLIQHVEGIVSAPGVTANILDVMAAMAVEDPFDRVDVSVRVTRLAMGKNLGAATVNWVDVSAQFRRIIGLTEGDAKLQWLQELIKLAAAKEESAFSKLYPAAEAKWIVAHSWNTAITHMRAGATQRAENLMSIAIQFARLTSSPDDAESTKKLEWMSEKYSTVLASANNN